MAGMEGGPIQADAVLESDRESHEGGGLGQEAGSWRQIQGASLTRDAGHEQEIGRLGQAGVHVCRERDH